MTPTKLLIGQILVVFAIVVAGVWAATQWCAAMLGYQPQLGEAWFTLAGIPFYRPWSIFWWWYSFEAYAPEVFDKAGTLAGASGFLGCAAAIGGSLWRSRQAKFVTTYGSARWAKPREIERAGLHRDAGVFLGRLQGRYLRHDGPEHVMAFAPTRSGKGVGLVVPTLLSWPGSAVIHDIKGENWQLTAGWRSRFSHALLFNPTDPLSAKYNPLLEVRRGEYEVRDVQNIADILVDPEGALERRSHWEKTSHSLLVGAILHILYAEEEKTLARVATFLSDPQRPFVATLKRMMSTNHLGTKDAPLVHPVVASAAREVLNKSENERSGVLSTAMSFLGLYRDPTVAEVTSRCDWRIADLVEADHPVSLYLVIPPSDISRTKPLVRLVLNQIGRRLTEKLDADRTRGRTKHQFLMMLDEFPALGRLDFFETSLAFMAGYGVRAFAPPATSKGQQLLREAARLRLAEMPLSCAFVLRAFLQHTIDSYMDKHGIPFWEDNRQLELRTRAERVIDHLISSKAAKAMELRGVRQTLTARNDPASIQALNDVHHDRYQIANVDTLRNAWDSAEPLFIAVYGAA